MALEHLLLVPLLFHKRSEGQSRQPEIAIDVQEYVYKVYAMIDHAMQ